MRTAGRWRDPDAFGFSATKIGGQDIGRQLQFVIVWGHVFPYGPAPTQCNRKRTFWDCWSLSVVSKYTWVC